ncbi:MAG: thermonuclease family protein [Pyrinomonadaceae bacterium]
MKKSSWQTTAEVLDVIDGDTFRARLDLGWRISLLVLVRVRGINAPEMTTDGGAAAREFLARVLPPGTIVGINSRRLDKYGRSEADVTLPNGADLARQLLDSGHVVAMRR